MNKRAPDWDIDRQIGSQAELWVSDLMASLKDVGRVEVKSDDYALKLERVYVEYECKGKNGWYPSGIAESEADLYVFKFGDLPGALVIEKNWLKRAAKHAYRNGALKECNRGSHPTKGVVVTLRDLWTTRDNSRSPII